MDYQELLNTSRTYLSGVRPPVAVDSVLRQRNFMTEEVLGYMKVRDTVIEVSIGLFIDHRIFGITFDRSSDSSPNELDCCLHSWDEVVTFLDGIKANA